MISIMPSMSITTLFLVSYILCLYFSLQCMCAQTHAHTYVQIEIKRGITRIKNLTEATKGEQLNCMTNEEKGWELKKLKKRKVTY